MSETADVSASTLPETSGFSVQLDNFTGPFDLLLGLIGKHELDITEVALAKVTDEFIAYIRRLQELGQEWALDEASEFLVIAATLLDLKAARLLPSGNVEDEEDIALLEARDLLFARLLQYKAFKEAAGIMGAAMTREANFFPRLVSLEPRFAQLLPELVWKLSPEQFAEIAAQTLKPKEPAPTEVGLTHLHAPAVSVREQAEILAHRLRDGKAHSFRALIGDADSTLVVVARFLALLELYRDRVIAFDQAAPLADLSVHWSAESTAWESSSSIEEYDATDTPATDTPPAAAAEQEGNNDE
ncbi:segregation and condensation protein A [Haematomicrobium sanguinis]|uniref:segregation and condensation protein A n=1 Tax=Haematomicrobium sanguinis TaxID=479106 RepID=UPI000689FAF8|nr:ScpA family protein [Haematomicrobium sanguinis]